MNWILIAFVFKAAANGDLDSPKMLYRGFPTEEACNFAGEHFRDEFILPVSTKSVSICIDKAAFDTVDWQILETPKSATSSCGNAFIARTRSIISKASGWWRHFETSPEASLMSAVGRTRTFSLI